MGIGEPHYAQIIKADKLNPINVYPEVGWDPIAWEVSEFATKSGEERIERDGNNVTIYSTSIRSHLTPDRIELQQGDHVTWHITNIETAHDAVHGFQLGGQNVSLSIEPGATVSFQFNADTDGTYAYYCTEFCSALHLEMMGYMLVAEEGAAPEEALRRRKKKGLKKGLGD
jgi:nitrous-oxide reductase